MRPAVTHVRLTTVIWCLIATAALLCSCSDRGPALPADSSPRSMHDILTSADSDEFLQSISLHPWGDENSRFTALFDWISKDARSTDAGRRTVAGQTARAVAQFLVNDSNRLRGVSNGDASGASIGEINPELTDTYAAALIPYLGAMVGDPRGTSGFEPLDPTTGEMPRTVAAFAVLRTGEAAAQHLSGALAELVDDYESGFVDSAVAQSSSVQPRDITLTRAARLLSAAKTSGFETVGEYVLDAGDVAAQLQYRLVHDLVDGPNVDISPQFFNRDRLMSPNEVRSRLGESSWDEYTNQLNVFLSKMPPLAEAVTYLQTTFARLSE